MSEKVKRDIFEINDPENLCFGSIMTALRCTGLYRYEKIV